MQAAAIPASLEAHRAAAAAALAPSQLLPEDRRPFVEALSRAALVAAAQRRRLVGRGKHGASGSTARISMRYHDLSYDAAHLTEAVLEEALEASRQLAKAEVSLSLERGFLNGVFNGLLNGFS